MNVFTTALLLIFIQDKQLLIKEIKFIVKLPWYITLKTLLACVLFAALVL